MNKHYYEVYIKNSENSITIPIICESIGKVDTQYYGYKHIFRDIITGTIVRPHYDMILEEIMNDELGTITYDNKKRSSYRKISPKKTLNLLKKLSHGNIDKYIENINRIETNQIERVLKRTKKKDVYTM